MCPFNPHPNVKPSFGSMSAYVRGGVVKGSEDAKKKMAALRAKRKAPTATEKINKKMMKAAAKEAAKETKGPRKGRFAKGSPEAKAHMAKIRAMKGNTITLTGK